MDGWIAALLHCTAVTCSRACICCSLQHKETELLWLMLQARSLLTAHEDFTTLMFTSPTEIQRPGLVFSFLKKYMPSEATVEEVKRMSLTADGKSAIFDVPSKLAQVCPALPCPALPCPALPMLLQNCSSAVLCYAMFMLCDLPHLRSLAWHD